MEFKGTKGKWKAKEPVDNWFDIETEDGLNVLRADILGHKQLLANAKLIASAPELLRLCDMVYKSFGDGNVITFSESDIEDFKTVLDKALQP